MDFECIRILKHARNPKAEMLQLFKQCKKAATCFHARHMRFQAPQARCLADVY